MERPCTPDYTCCLGGTGIQTLAKPNPFQGSIPGIHFHLTKRFDPLNPPDKLSIPLIYQQSSPHIITVTRNDDGYCTVQHSMPCTSARLRIVPALLYLSKGCNPVLITADQTVSTLGHLTRRDVICRAVPTLGNTQDILEAGKHLSTHLHIHFL